MMVSDFRQVIKTHDGKVVRACKDMDQERILHPRE